MKETQIIVMPDGAEMEAPADAPRDEIKRRIGNYLKTLPKDQIDAIPTAARKAFGLGMGDVAKAAAKRLPNMVAATTEDEAAQSKRDLWAQGVREIGAPIAAVGVGVATGGLGLLPALGAAAATGAAGETAAQATSRGADIFNTDVAKHVAVAGALEATGELGGRFLAAGIQKALAARVAKAARGAAPASTQAAGELAKQIGFPDVAGAPRFVQEKFNARQVQAVSEYGDKILADLGGGLSEELQGGKIKTVFQKIEDVFLAGQKSLRQQVVKAVGNEPAIFNNTAPLVSDIQKTLPKRPIKADVLVEHIEALKNVDTLDDALAFRTDLGKNMNSLRKGDPARPLLERMYGTLSDDIEASIRAKDPVMADAFRSTNDGFSVFFGGLKNHVIGGMVKAAKEGNGMAVVSELEKATPKDIREMFAWVKSTVPSELGSFTESIQRNAAQRVLGITEDGAPTLGVGMAERLADIGGDRLREIFGQTTNGPDVLKRIEGLAGLTARYQKNLKIPPQALESANVVLMKSIANAAAIAGLATYGGTYGAALAAARGTKLGTEMALQFVLERPELYRKLSSGMNKVYSSISAPTARAADALVKIGVNEVQGAVRIGARDAIRRKAQPHASEIAKLSQAQAAR